MRIQTLHNFSFSNICSSTCSFRIEHHLAEIEGGTRSFSMCIFIPRDAMIPWRISALLADEEGHKLGFMYYSSSNDMGHLLFVVLLFYTVANGLA